VCFCVVFDKTHTHTHTHTHTPIRWEDRPVSAPVVRNHKQVSIQHAMALPMHGHHATYFGSQFTYFTSTKVQILTQIRCQPTQRPLPPLPPKKRGRRSGTAGRGMWRERRGGGVTLLGGRGGGWKMVQEMLTTASFAPTAHCNGLLGTVALARVVPSLLALLVVSAAALADCLIRANRILQWVFARYRVYWIYWYKSTNTDVEEALLVEMLTTASNARERRKMVDSVLEGRETRRHIALLVRAWTARHRCPLPHPPLFRSRTVSLSLRSLARSLSLSSLSFSRLSFNALSL
jgi:hypothetical protein